MMITQKKQPTNFNTIIDKFRTLVELDSLQSTDVKYINYFDVSDPQSKYRNIHNYIITKKSHIISRFRHQQPEEIRVETPIAICIYCKNLGVPGPLFSNIDDFHVILRQDNFEDSPIYHKKTLVETPRKSFDEWMSNITQIKKYVGLINMMLEEADNYNFVFRLTHDEMQRKILRELWRKSQPSTIIIK